MSEKKYELSVCAVVKNESEYIAEWILFEMLQGVQHFYIYHNADVDEDGETYAAIHPFVSRGIVTYTRWPLNPPQFGAYNHCLQYYGKDSEWIAFIDVDEFLFASDGFDTDDEGNDDDRASPFPLPELLKVFTYGKDKCAGIAVHWVLFGSGEYDPYNKDTLVIDRFTQRSATVNPHVKSIMRPEHTLRVGNDPHSFKVKKDYVVLNENDMVLPEHYANNSKNPTARCIRIAHFHTKTYEEYLKRKQNPDPGSGKVYTLEEIAKNFTAHDLNEVTDLFLYKNFSSAIRVCLSLL